MTPSTPSLRSDSPMPRASPAVHPPPPVPHARCPLGTPAPGRAPALPPPSILPPRAISEILLAPQSLAPRARRTPAVPAYPVIFALLA